MNPQERKHFVILVHHGSSKVTRRALSLLAGCHMPPDKIIVIDHAKQPFSAAPHSSCRITRPQQNGGYAAGVNVGLGILISLNVKKGTKYDKTITKSSVTYTPTSVRDRITIQDRSRNRHRN